MTLLDASIIIDGLRAKDMRLLERMKSVGGVVCGVTRSEILSGARGYDDRQRLLTILDGFQQVAIPEPLWDDVGAIQAQLRAGGLTVPLADAILATVAIMLDVDLWANDAHFSQIQRILPNLRLLSQT